MVCQNIDAITAIKRNRFLVCCGFTFDLLIKILFIRFRDFARFENGLYFYSIFTIHSVVISSRWFIVNVILGALNRLSYESCRELFLCHALKYVLYPLFSSTTLFPSYSIDNGYRIGSLVVATSSKDKNCWHWRLVAFNLWSQVWSLESFIDRCNDNLYKLFIGRLWSL